MKSIRWTSENIRIALEILRQESDLTTAFLVIQRAVKFKISRSSIDCAFAAAGLQTPYSYLKKNYDPDTVQFPVARVHDLPDDSATTAPTPVAQATQAIPPPPPSEAPLERFEDLVDFVRRATKKGTGVTFEQLCDELELTPSRARQYLSDAKDIGITIDIAHDRLFFRPPENKSQAPPIPVAPSTVSGTAHRIAIFSDLHFGSHYCLREQFTEFVRMAYEMGVRDFFCPGDVIEGCYRHAQFERSCESLEEQQNEFLGALPVLKDARIFLIDGNHDATFTERTGVESGRNLIRIARDRGLGNLYFFGSRGALVQYGNTRIEMWHPKKGAGYALSYQLQNHIRDTAPERLPHLLFTGHTHQYVKLRRSNVWAWYCGTFQHGDAPYGRSLGGDVAMGGMIVDWVVDDDGVVRELADKFHVARHDAKTFDVSV